MIIDALAVSVKRMTGSARGEEAQRLHATGLGRGDARVGVLDHDTVLRGHSQRLRGRKKEVGERLAACNILRGDDGGVIFGAGRRKACLYPCTNK